MSNTTPYHPESNGQCERANRTIINMLKSIPENEKKNWKDHLAKLMFAYNSTVNKTTQFSPFFLLFGRCPRLPIDDMFPEVSPQKDGSSEGVSGENIPSGKNWENRGEFARTWDKRMTQAYEIANKNIGKSGQYNKNKHDQRPSCKIGAELSIGDRVVVRNVRHKGTTRAGKLASFWNPVIHEVTDRRGDLPVYVVRELNAKGKKTKTLHRNLLKEVNELVPVPDSVPTVTPGKTQTVTVPVPSIHAPAPNTGVGESQSVNCLPHRKKRSIRKQKIVDAPVLRQSSSSDSDSDDELVVVRKKPVAPRDGRKSFSLQGRGEPRRVSDLPVVPPPVNEAIVDDVQPDESDLPVVPPPVDEVIVDEVQTDESLSEPELAESEPEPNVNEVIVDDVPPDESLSEPELAESEPEYQEHMVEENGYQGVVSESDIESEVESEGEGDETIHERSEEPSESEDNVCETDAASSTDQNESFHSAFNDSLDLEPDESPPVRRSNRPRKAPKKLVYDELGVPGLKTSTVRIKRPKDSKFK